MTPTQQGTPAPNPRARWWDIESLPATPLQRAMLRGAIGSSTVVLLAIAIVLVTVGGVALHEWSSPSRGSGAGQGEGIVAGLALLLTPIPGLFAAWKPWLGVAIGGVLLTVVAALHVAILAGL